MWLRRFAMSVKVEEMLKELSYEGCNCPPDYKSDLGVINGFCPKHKGQLLLKGESIDIVRRRLRDRLNVKRELTKP